MQSKIVRQKFLDFFKDKDHLIVDSAPMVVKDDPTLMFTNAGMNQFKDVFLGNRDPKSRRVADTQKCLRVSGKHNDLDEVGHDTYHHTMFEMLGNWSFGDYFKKEAIDWAWELLTGVFKLDPNRLYATVFGGDKGDGLEKDNEAFDLWKQHLPEERILDGSKKDNFWEMGDTGPCGPCSEIHIDLRDDKEREATSGADLVNMDHPLVIEVWNLVFIQFNRMADKSLVALPNKHVDTGMGFERLCMALQGKKSNYDTDVFQPLIQKLASESGKQYGKDENTDIALRVISDHIRAISFSIADGQMPSNVKAGYVIRRILRRAVRYGYTYLNFREPFMYKLVDVLESQMGESFPELAKQKGLIEKVVKEEELSFLRTLETGIQLLDQIIKNLKEKDYKVVDGKTAFELYDTYGFPLDLTELILAEQDLVVNRKEFETEMKAQKDRSRAAGSMETDDWVVLAQDDKEEFVGYDSLQTKVKITKYRKVSTGKKSFFQLVFNISPFYAESGGQVGDKGYIEADGKKTYITDTKKENELSIHIVEELPENVNADFIAVVNGDDRDATAANHSATHIMHYVLRKRLGDHVEQKGSLVAPDYFRFDFSHFQKVTAEELMDIENEVNDLIRKNIPLTEKRAIPMAEAQDMGALMLFGEKYGDLVRVIKFGDSVELCGGTHVDASGKIGLIKITAEGAIAAGIRRIEAISGAKAIEFYEDKLSTVNELKELVRNPKEPLKALKNLIEKNSQLEKQLEELVKEKAGRFSEELIAKAEDINGIRFASAITDLDAGAMKDLAFKHRSDEKLVMVLGSAQGPKAILSVMVSDDLVKGTDLKAGNIIREISKLIQGGGGGQPFFATAGGKNPGGLEDAILKAKEIVKEA